MARTAILSATLLIASSIVWLSGCGSSSKSEGQGPDEEPDSQEICENDDDCDDGVFCTGEATCSPGSDRADAQGCVHSRGPCIQGQSCDEGAARCFTLCDETEDADGDGHRAGDCGGDDCDDSNANRYPGNGEVCDSEHVDEDCDPDTFGFRDSDDDTYPDSTCCNETDNGELKCGTDCDDQDPRTHPTQVELCDGLDNDCNGEIDDLTGQGATWYLDADGDLFGDPEFPLLSCEADLSTYVTNNTDCDDSKATVNPSARDDDCDGVDNNCSGKADSDAISIYFIDADGDGSGNPELPAPPCSILGAGTALDNRDCDDSTAERAWYLPELDCDGVDNDCDGEVDTDATELPRWYVDLDGDDHGDHIKPSALGCDPGAEGPEDDDLFTTSPVEDCDDTRDFIFYGAPELCDGWDNNCSSGGILLPVEDLDGDEHTAPGYKACTGGFPKDDCDDENNQRFPGNTTSCDGIDNDCDDLLDPIEDADRDGFGKAGCEGPSGVDCDDTRADTYPGAPEPCDNYGNDCDSPTGGQVIAEDIDGDGYRQVDAVCELPELDCNDGVAQIQTEICGDSIDNDCVDGIDQGCAVSYSTPLGSSTTLLSVGDTAGSVSWVSAGCERTSELLSGLVVTGGAGAVSQMSLLCKASELLAEGTPLVVPGGDERAGGDVTLYAPSASADITELSCPSEKSVVGLRFAEVTSEVHNVYLVCARLVFPLDSTDAVHADVELIGAGASPAPTSGHTCEDGEVIEEVSTREFLAGTEIRVRCRPFRAELAPLGLTAAWLAPEETTVATIAGEATSTAELDCPQGAYVRGFNVWQSGSNGITGLGLRCAQFRLGAQSRPQGGLATDGPQIVASNSVLSSDDCLGSAYASGLDVRNDAGESLVRATLICRAPTNDSLLASQPIEFNSSTDAQTITSGSGGQVTLRCPQNKPVVGATVATDDTRIRSIQLKCAGALPFLP